MFVLSMPAQRMPGSSADLLLPVTLVQIVQHFTVARDVRAVLSSKAPDEVLIPIGLDEQYLSLKPRLSGDRIQESRLQAVHAAL